MCSRNLTRTSTAPCSDRIRRLGEELRRADAVVVGAGAGLSVSAGLSYDGPRFEENFADFIAKYHFRDMYSAGFYPYDSPEEFWAYWSRHIYLNRYDRAVGAPYSDLLALLRDKDYFVITTNVDHCFQQAGFDKLRLFYTQGDYGLWQCSRPCHQKTYDNEGAVRRMVLEQTDLRVASALLPRCPVCGAPMAMNLRCDGSFVEDEGWHAARFRYEAFLRGHEGGRTLFLELGVGENTPGIIKYPFWKLARQNKNAFYACVNLDAAAPCDLPPRCVCIDRDIGAVLASLRRG